MTDSLYHRLFSHPAMVEQLIRDFIPEAAAAGIDFARLESVPAKHHAGDGQRREGDVIWRLPCADGSDVYLYLLLEFQSQPDRWMAVRVQTYAGLLWQRLIREKRLAPGRRLPPLLPVVVYNGDAPWREPTATADLVALPSDSWAWPWQPQIRYYLLDEGALIETAARRDSLVALLFRLEHCRDVAEMTELAEACVAWLRTHPGYETLKSAFLDLFQATALDFDADAAPAAGALQEGHAMLATRMQRWAQEFRDEGRVEGLQVGRSATLRRLLTRRFGPLPADFDRRLSAADTDQLDRWTDKLLDAPSLDALFDEAP